MRGIYRTLILTRIPLLLCIISSVMYSQNTSDEYSTIKTSKDFNNAQIEHKLDSLISSYKTQSIDSVDLYDTYDYAKWQFVTNNNTEKAISVSYACLELFEGATIAYDDIKYSTINNLAFFYRNIGDYHNAYLTQKRIIALPSVSSSDLIEAYKLAANNLFSLGDFYKAIDYYKNAISLAKKEHYDYSEYIILCVDASINYRQINDERSIRSAKALLLDIVNTLDGNNKLKTTINPSILFRLYDHLGNLYGDSSQFDFDAADRYFRKAIVVAQSIEDKRLLGYAYNDIGYLYARSKKPEAKSYLENALTYLEDIETTSICYSNLRLHFINNNDLDNAMLSTQKSINTLAQFDISNAVNLPDKIALSESLYKSELLIALIEKSELWIKFHDNNSGSNHYNLKNALNTLKLADYLVDEIRFESSEQESKLFWRSIASRIYNNAARACYLLNNAEEGWYYIEKNKALLLLEDVTRQQLRDKGSLPKDIDERHKLLSSTVVNLKTELNYAKNDSLKDRIRLTLTSAKDNYQNFIDSLETTPYKSFYKSLKKADVIALKDAQKSLKDRNKAYVNYILSDDFGYGIVVSNESYAFFEIDDANELLELSKTYRNLLAKPFANKSDIERYNSIAQSIYNKLLPKQVLDVTKDRDLIIIPDYYLQNLPFEALMTNENPNSYLIIDKEISYAYSISFLLQNSKSKRDNDKEFLSFAPISFKTGLATLTYSQNEIDTISKSFSSLNLIQENASSQNFMDNIKGYDIIHLATHASANDSISPWIAFNDRNLSLNELYLVDNTADLVVLSACETSLGKIKQGEGVMSLARVFFNTGSNSVVSSLWNVNDKSGSEIIANFYTNLRGGAPKSKALRQAKLDYINSNQLTQKSPFYWASFVLIGDANEIPSMSNSTYVLMIGIALFILILLIFFLKRKK